MFKRHHLQIALLGLGLVATALSGAEAFGADAHKHHKSQPHKVHHAKGTAGKTASEDKPASAAAKELANQLEQSQSVRISPSTGGAIEAVEAVEAVEPVDAVEPIEAAAATGGDAAPTAKAEDKAATQLSWADRAVLLLGHMHAAVVHLPIAWVLLWLLFDVAAIWLGQRQLLSAGPWLGAMATLSFAPAVLSGLLRFDELSKASADAHTMDPALVHRNLMYWALGLCVVTFFTRKKALAANPVLAKIFYTALLVICFSIVGFSAHLGGQLVYGEEFLQF